MPAIRAIVEKVQAFVDKLNSLDDAQKQTVVKIALIAAAVGPLLIAFGKTISTVGSVMTGFSALTKGVAKLGVKLAGSTGSVTSLGSALGAVAGPVLAVAAIVAVFDRNHPILLSGEYGRESRSGLLHLVMQSHSG